MRSLSQQGSTEADYDRFITELLDAHTDITGADVVTVHHSKDRSVLWVNVNGICVLRICRIVVLDTKEISHG